MCSVFTVVQFRSYGDLVYVTNVLTIMSVGKCKLSNVCVCGGTGWRSWLRH